MHNIGDHNELFALAVKNVVQIYINGSFTLASVLIMLVVVYTIMNGLVFNDSNRMDLKPIIRAIAVIFLIVFYQDIMNAISAGIAMFTGQFVNNESIVQKLVKLSEVRPIENPANIETEDLGEKISNYLTSAFDITAVITGAFERGITLVIREIILMLRTIILGFLFLAGPIALAFSLIPKFEGLAIRWFQGWLAVQCWAITLTILDNLVDTYQFGTDDSTLRFIANNLVVIIMYILVPYLTTYFIGGTAAGSFISKVIGTAAIFLAAAKSRKSSGGKQILRIPIQQSIGTNKEASQDPGANKTEEAPRLKQRNNSIQVQRAQ